MLKKLVGILVFATIFGCKDDPQRNQGRYHIETYSSKINGLPTISSTEEFYELNPDFEIKDSCAYMNINYKQGRFYFDCIRLLNRPGVVYRKIMDTIYLSEVDFSKSDVKLQIDSLEISAKTTVTDLEHRWPDIRSKLNVSAAFPYTSMKGIYVLDKSLREKTSDRNVIRLIFKEDSIFKYKYTWYPEYSDDQWALYQKAKKEIERTGSYQLENYNVSPQ